MQNLHYVCDDFVSRDYEKESFDVIHFNSSLHHFENVETLLREKVRPLLKPDGYLVLFEYVGPSRLQWRKEQMKFVNSTLKEIPGQYRLKSRLVKKKVYRPGLLRMKMIDPSEAVDSESIIPALHENFKIVEEKQVGWDVTHLLLKDIAQNFLNDDPETKKWIKYIFDKEDEYLNGRKQSDAVFGVYQK
jgi:SAM-dependent methyltransferase